MGEKISDERKTAFYLGSAMMVIGGLLFVSVFITGAFRFGDFTNFESDARSSMLRAISGMFLLMIGGGIRAIGMRGLAGAGVILDPKQARSDLEPYSRMVGGMVKDVMDEADVEIGLGRNAQVVMIRCRECDKLNEEDSKFCQECGQPL